jgi:membrane-bound serine protease (ClpP class)
MKPLFSLLLTCLLFPGSGFPQETSRSGDAVPPNRGRKEWSDSPKVYLIPVRQAIFHPQLFLLRRGVEKAREHNADAIVLLMDTPGGSVEIMQKMVNPIIDLDIPTYTLVENQAISAGAIIALSTDYVYMTPRSTIGDAMPVVMGQGGYAELGEAEREKIESYMDAIVRSIAQAKGRDENLIRAMVRRNLEFTLEDGTVISKEGEILTLTNQEAEQLLPDGTPLLSEGTVEDLDNLLNRIGLGDAERIELLPSLADDLALLITRIAPILVSIAFVLFYMEIQSPGIGWAGGLAAGLFIVIVFGHNVAGLAGMEDLVLIAIGLILLVVEIFILPGFGIAGFSGLACLIFGLIRAMTIRYPGNPGELPAFVNMDNLGEAVTSVSLSVIGATIGIALLMRSLNESSPFGRGLVLADALPSTAREPEQRSLKSLIGQTGTASTPLTPSGTVALQSGEIDALSDGEYLDADTPVRVIEVRNNRVIVSRLSGEPV